MRRSNCCARCPESEVRMISGPPESVATAHVGDARAFPALRMSNGGVKDIILMNLPVYIFAANVFQSFPGPHFSPVGALK